MDPAEYLRGIKRRWRVVAAVVALALVGAWGLSSVAGVGGSKGTASATATLLQASAKTSSGGSRSTTSAPTGTSSIQTIAALVTVDQVAVKVAKQIAYVGDPKQLAKRIKAEVDTKSGFLKITATAKEPERAKLLANAFSQQLLAFLIERETVTNNAFAKALGDQINRVRKDVAALDVQIRKYPAAAIALKAGATGSGRSGGGSEQVAANTGTPADPLIVQRNAALKEIESLSTQLQEVKSRTADAEGLQMVQSAIAGKGTSGLALPSSLLARLLIAGILGLLGGLGLALIRERFDRRIRTRESVERHFSLPVLAEIPTVRARGLIPWRRKTPSSVRISELPPAVADAYRLLGAGLNGPSSTTNGNVPGHDRRLRPRAILVTSAGPGDGKTSVLASLAATFAAVGKTVTVVSCDFRHPEVHNELGVTNERGVTDVILSSNGSALLSSALWQTPVSGVWAVPSGTSSAQPDQLLSSPAMRRLLMEARQLSDLVLIDTSPILTSDAAFLLPEVDGVLVVVKAGTTKPELAERSAEMLKRLKAPVLGVVLTGTTEAALPRGYYRTWTPRQLVLRAPGTILRGTGRVLKTVLRVGRRRNKAATQPLAGEAAKTISIDAPAAPAEAVAKVANGSSSDRGFPRLMRRSGNR
jgi:capsular exopolysaccharide synthesis family protein